MPFLSRNNKTPLGIYIHVPFCRSKCQYCDFYSVTAKEDKLLGGYLDAVCTHIREAGALAPGYLVDTVYFGGGTPSFFGADGMAVILNTIRKALMLPTVRRSPSRQTPIPYPTGCCASCAARASTGSVWASSVTTTRS